MSTVKFHSFIFQSQVYKIIRSEKNSDENLKVNIFQIQDPYFCDIYQILVENVWRRNIVRVCYTSEAKTPPAISLSISVMKLIDRSTFSHRQVHENHCHLQFCFMLVHMHFLSLLRFSFNIFLYISLFRLIGVCILLLYHFHSFIFIQSFLHTI